MDPVVKQMFDDLLQRFDSFRTEFDGLGSRLDQRFSASEAARVQRDAAIDDRVQSLEDFASAQYTAAIVADNWGGHFSARIDELEDRVGELEKVRYVEIQDERDERVLALESAAAAFEAWRPQIEGSLNALRSQVNRLSSLGDRSCAAHVVGSSPHQGTSELVAGRASAGAPTDWPRGHGVASITRDTGYGSISAMTPYPANGTFSHPLPPPHPPPQPYPPDHPPPLPYPPPPVAHPPPPCPYPPPNQIHPPYNPYTNFAHPTPPSVHPYPNYIPAYHNYPPPPAYSNSPANPNLGHLPKMLFPQFDGDNPKLWLSRARSHFEMYSVHPSVWVRVATHHFTHAAARWLQSVESEVQNISWEAFSSLIHERFSRDQHELLLRQLFHITHTSSVSDYIEKFTDLYEQLKAYNPNPDKLYFTTRFIDGLREDIRSVVLVSRPQDLDSACTLALLQEEALDQGSRKDYKCSEASPFARSTTIKGALPLPPAPRRPQQEPDKRPAPRPTNVDDKLATLRNYRKARNLCIRCGEKWAPGHRCAPVPQVHALQEVWALCSDVFDDPETSDPDYPTDPVEAEQAFMLLSSAALSVSSHPKTLQFRGQLRGQNILILVDSGSSHSFISTNLASKFNDLTTLTHPMAVRVADGNSICCTSELSGAEWSVQGISFHSDLRVIPLGCYDMIVGMDWLQAFSPMKVDWVNKWISIPYGTRHVRLQGIPPDSGSVSLIQLLNIAASEPSSQSEHQQIPIEIQQLIDEFADLFAEPTELPPRRHCDHHIPLVPGATPVAMRQYRYKPALKDEIEKQVSEMLHSGLIRPSNSPFSSPVLLVRKKDNTWRFCVDYRMLNALTVKTKFPIPVVDELLDELSHAKWFTCLDLRAGFNQIRLAPGEEFKTAFQTHWGQFEYNVMSFGLTGAPNTFQGAMNSTLLSLLRKCALVFFDDILIYSPTFDAHIHHLRQVFQLLAADQWKVKFSKCQFGKQSISYLGHIVGNGGVSTDPSKIQSVQLWPQPNDVKELRRFLGLAGYYRKFVKNYAAIARPLTDLLKKNCLFVWTQAHTAAFQALKDALVSAPVLALPDFSKQFHIQTDASDSGVGAVLLQDGHPLAFVSKSLGPRTSALSTYEKEFLAILVAVEHWRSYLQHAEFIIFTDQRSLMHVTDQRLHTQWQLKMYHKLSGLQYKIVYKPGISNSAADALSRHPSPPAQLQAVSVCTPTWLADLVAGYDQDPDSQELLKQLAVHPDARPPFRLVDGVIRYSGRIWVGANVTLQQRIISALHASAIGGHSGFPVTHSRVKKLFCWKGLKRTVKDFVSVCTICIQAKPDRSRYPGLLAPLPVPTEAWQVISMDFIEGLPTSASSNCIMVIVDKLTKYAHFVPLHHPFNAQKVAQAFLDHVFKLHGMPVQIISDRDPIFTSQFWRELFRLAQVSLSMSSAYHPQSDGQTERVNQCLETYLRCFVHSCPRRWIRWISLAEFWYNTSEHSALGKSPFEVLYGHSPRHFGLTDDMVSPVSDVTKLLEERSTMLAAVRQHLLRAQQRMKHQADKRRSERSFQVGDFVYLRLHPAC